MCSKGVTPFKLFPWTSSTCALAGLRWLHGLLSCETLLETSLSDLSVLQEPGCRCCVRSSFQLTAACDSFLSSNHQKLGGYGPWLCSWHICEQRTADQSICFQLLDNIVCCVAEVFVFKLTAAVCAGNGTAPQPLIRQDGIWCIHQSLCLATPNCCESGQL